jgi:hypothetical protein
VFLKRRDSVLGVSPMPGTRALYEFILAQNSPSRIAASEGGAAAPSVLVHGDERRAFEHDAGVFDQELTRLRSLISVLNSHRQSVFSTLAEIGVT